MKCLEIYLTKAYMSATLEHFWEGKEKNRKWKDDVHWPEDSILLRCQVTPDWYADPIKYQ